MESPRPLKMLHVINVPRRGGSGAAASRLARALAEQGHEVQVICPPDHAFIDGLEIAGVKVITDFPIKWDLRPWTFRCLLRMRRFLRAEGFDVLHVHRSTDHWLCGLAAATIGNRPVVVRTRHIVVPVKRNFATRWLFQRLTDRTIAVADVIYCELLASGIFTEHDTVMVPGAIEMDRFAEPVRGKLREKLGAGPDDPMVAIVARLAKVKGHEYFLEAAEQVSRKHPAARFAIIGDGGRREELEEQASQLECRERIHFLGWQDKVEELLPDVDVYVLASVGSEGSSRATLEAMAVRIPVVATTVGVLPETVVDGETGRLVPPRDASALAKAIVEVLESPERAAMGERGRERVQRAFSLAEMVRRTETVYRDVLKEKGKQSRSPHP